MFLPQWDWLVIWKIYHYPWFFWMYAVVSMSVRMLVLPRLNPAFPIKTWLLSSTASLLIVPAVPLLALPAFALVALLVGRVAMYSLLMALPIALSVGLIGALIDGMLLRFLLGQVVGRRRMWFLIGTNLLITILAIGAVVTLMLIHPPEIIAMN